MYIYIVCTPLNICTLAGIFGYSCLYTYIKREQQQVYMDAHSYNIHFHFHISEHFLAQSKWTTKQKVF